MGSIIGYQVTDTRTGSIVKTFAAGKSSAAHRYADRRDSEYGAVRYSVRPIVDWSEVAQMASVEASGQ